MKNIIFSIAVCLITINLMAQKTIDTNVGTTTLEVPSQIEIGTFSVVSVLAKVTTVSINVTADSAVQSFNKEVEVDFDGVTELTRQMSEIEIILDLKNPKDMIRVDVFLEDYKGQKLFQGKSDFYLQKVYDKEGNISYQMPQWAISVYFTRCEVNINYPGMTSAYLVDKNGEKAWLSVNDEEVFIHGSVLRSEYKYLVINSTSGEHIYDFLTGQLLQSEKIAADVEQIYVDGIQYFDVTGDNELVLELYPEHNYVPVIETDFSSNYMILDVRSSWGYEPIAVHITQLDDLRDNQEPTVVSYYDGMIIEGGGTIYLWFEFSPFVYGQAENGGGKG